MMKQLVFEDQNFEGIDFTAQPLDKGEYESCIFSNCIFSGQDLAHFVFIECEFIHCDLSTVNLKNTAFRDIQFKHCKLLGLHFDDCNDFLFEANFESCILNLSSFYGRKLKKTRFEQCSLREVDFGNADLSEAIFPKCDFLGATFDYTNLEKADFRTAINYSIDPETNPIKKAKFSLDGLVGLLHKYDIKVS